MMKINRLDFCPDEMQKCDYAIKFGGERDSKNFGGFDLVMKSFDG